MPLIDVRGVVKRYRLGTHVLEALKGVSLSLAAGEFTVLAGPSGSGKTTLLNLIGGLEKPDAGTVAIDGVDTAGLGRNDLTDLRAHKIGFVFQNFNLLPVLTAQENVEYPLYQKPMADTERGRRAREALAQVGLSDFAHHRPRQMSGGQQQRVAIARAIAARPAIILADEPSANLDHATGEEILRLMKSINKEQRTTFLFSTHDPRIIAQADRVIRLADGMLE